MLGEAEEIECFAGKSECSSSGKYIRRYWWRDGVGKINHAPR